MEQTLIFIDTETTGTGPDDKLIQVAYRTTDGVDVNELYKPNLPIEIGAMAIHHITEKMIADKPAFLNSETYIDLEKRFARGEIFIAHNAKFDIDMVEREGLRVGTFIDTLKVARHLDPESKIESYGMQYLRYLLGIEITATAHDAWGDILVLEQVFYRMLKKIMETQDISKDKPKVAQNLRNELDVYLKNANARIPEKYEKYEKKDREIVYYHSNKEGDIDNIAVYVKQFFSTVGYYIIK